ncbi:hypothetical protein LTR02_011692 [Friedmanniomyces endolithicus]|nr:hypothetical protein LTR94_015099 [Friedmanniomyces endolithicus]KAK0783638.1 hypothetical protein LTR38_012938 [Friedmanniomyces endolithicus]KAK0789159.1 hypothetical protein LTR75_012420 [Friedmanniomyces endolithicus]KAK0799035.1 hypothetical protein LTR59_006281 [Friedmanniomyces endolithicus]KAK0836837.1 hypothetical protein LTR03_013305 [Friedmanniomyces endolithicus]
MSPPTISIVGAGLSGLVLGRCLKQRGTPCIIFDRDTAAAAATRYSYGITLYPWAYRPLLRYLDLNEATFQKTVAVDSYIGGVGRLSSHTRHGSNETDGFRANRRKLEKMLREGLDVRWEHDLTEISSEEGSNSMVFGNGQKLQASIVVGADGPHSQVRRAFTPNSNFTILPYAVYNGKCRVDPKTFEDKFAPHMNGANVIEHRIGQTLLQITVADRTETSVSISYTYSRPARGLADLGFTPERSAAGASRITDQLFDEVRSLGVLEEPFGEVFDAEKMRTDRLLNWLMRSISVDAAELNTGAGRGILLVGDAAHATPILGGDGANAAIQDCVDLAEYIVQNGTSDLAGFYGTKDETWRSYVRDGEDRLAKMHGQAGANATVPIGSHLDGIERVYEISARTTMEDPIHTRRATRGTGSCWDMYNAHQSMGIAAAEDVF